MPSPRINDPDLYRLRPEREIAERRWLKAEVVAQEGMGVQLGVIGIGREKEHRQDGSSMMSQSGRYR